MMNERLRTQPFRLMRDTYQHHTSLPPTHLSLLLLHPSWAHNSDAHTRIHVLRSMSLFVNGCIVRVHIEISVILFIAVVLVGSKHKLTMSTSTHLPLARKDGVIKARDRCTTNGNPTSVEQNIWRDAEGRETVTHSTCARQR